MGIYEKIIDIVMNFFKDVEKNIKYLFPLFVGAVIGILLFSKVLIYIFSNYDLQSKALFVGLILRECS